MGREEIPRISDSILPGNTKEFINNSNFKTTKLIDLQYFSLLLSAPHPGVLDEDHIRSR